MAEIIRNRTIRPSSRLATSKGYKIDTKQVSTNDTLIVNLDHETKAFKKTFKFSGKELVNRDSISFRAYDEGSSVQIVWNGIQPIQNGILQTKPAGIVPVKSLTQEKPVRHNFITLKSSLEPISNENTEVLILGTMPGDKSLEVAEYYAHPRNRFWKILSTITQSNIPFTYSEKTALLLNSKIGVWDVLHSASRKGSLDSAILNAKPNDLENFISKHFHLKVIGFNGTKSEEYYDKYFTRINGIKYLSLPSSSPANTSKNFEEICKAWAKVIKLS